MSPGPTARAWLARVTAPLRRAGRGRAAGRVSGLFLAVAALAPPAPGETPPRLALEPVVPAGLRDPVYVTPAGDGSGRLFVVEQRGVVRAVRDGTLLSRPFLDIAARVRAGGEQGLLGLAFHPRYRETGRYFVNYTRAPDGATVVAEYRVSRDPDRSETTERVLLVVPQPYTNHNGGMLAFGPDGFLYIALGDGGAAGDPGNRAQNPEELLGKILRVDVDRPGAGRPYGIPPDNPFARGGGRPEVFALGLRNPWRFSFDRQTGELWAGDVGQNRWEEIDVIRSGGNYGWRIMEGRHCFHPPVNCPTQGLVPPVAEYRLAEGRCSVIGGYVYRGRRLPGLVGTYLFGDYCSGEVFALVQGQVQVLLRTPFRIASFGEDEEGELYLVNHGGSVHRLTPAPR